MPDALSPDPGHVLMTTDAVGGVWTYALDLARVFASRGVRVSLAVLGPSPSDAQRAEAQAIPALELREHSGRLEWMDDPWRDVARAGEWLRELERAVEPDVVHLNGYTHAALPWSAPVIVVAHSCVLSWWRAVHAEDAPPSWDRYADAVRRGVAAADLVVAPSAAMLAELVSCYGPLPRTRVIPNGRDPVWRVALHGKEPFVLTAGRLWDQGKNVETVCAIAREIAWPVYVAGDVRRPDTEAFACEDVRMLGRLSSEKTRDWMARASIYACPARYEPFGLSVLEAAQAGCALVLGDIRSLREIWGDAALFVAPGNRRMLAAAVSRLIDDDEARRALGERARTRAAPMTAARMAEDYLRTYSELMAESTREVRPLLSLSAV
jgi:glycosyltransferase involved in cell wall biosynthesis